MGKKNTKEALADETNILVNRILSEGVDGITAGFPCQDISGGNRNNGGGSGLAGARSGLFWLILDTARLVGCKFLLLENVAALFRSDRQSDMGTILGALAAEWSHIEWDCVGAGTVGAPHHRARAYFLADHSSDRRKRLTPQQISRQPDFSQYEGIRSIKDLRDRPGIFGRLICRNHDGLAKRLHGIGNGNPPCVIREIMKNLPTKD